MNAEGPISQDEMLRPKKSRVKLVLLAGAVVIGGGGFFGLRAMGQAQREALQAPMDAVSTCFVGEPQTDGAAFSRAIRNAQLVEMAQRDRDRGANPWPDRCLEPLGTLGQALQGAGDDKLAPVTEKLDALVEELRKPNNINRDFGNPATAFLTAAIEAGLAPKSKAEGVEGPPAFAEPLDAAALEKNPPMLGQAFSLSNVYASPFLGEELHLLLDEKGHPKSPSICSYRPEKTTLECSQIPAPAADLSPGLRLWGTTEKGITPFVYAGERGDGGIFRSDTGKRVARFLAYGASANVDGSVQSTGWNEKEKEVSRIRQRPGEKKPTIDKLLDYDEVGNPYYNSGLFWNWLVYKGYRKGADGIRLMARYLDPKKAPGEMVDVGPIPERSIVYGENDPPHIEACRTTEAMVIRVRGEGNTFLSFHHDGTWHKPVTSPGLKGRLTCDGTQAFITSEEGTVFQSQCSVSGCKYGSVSRKKAFSELERIEPSSLEEVKVAELGGKVLLLWKAADRGGLRMRLAPIERLADAEDRVLYDDLIDDGAVGTLSTLIDMKLIPGHGYVLLLLATAKGNFPFVVDGEGAMRPVTVTMK